MNIYISSRVSARPLIKKYKDDIIADIDIKKSYCAGLYTEITSFFFFFQLIKKKKKKKKKTSFHSDK